MKSSPTSLSGSQRQDQSQAVAELIWNGLDADASRVDVRLEYDELEEKLSRLKAKVARKDQIIAEVTEEYVTLKKNLGKPEWCLDSP